MEQLFNCLPTEKLHLCQIRKPHNILSNGMVFYEVETEVDYKRSRFNVKILREYIVIKNDNEGKVTTLCIHHCENYSTSERTDWKKKISRQFKHLTTPKELENLYYMLPLEAVVKLFADGTRLFDRKKYDELSMDLLFFKKKETENE